MLSFDPLDELLVTNHGLNHLVQNPANLQEYIHVIRELVADKVARETLGRQLREHILTHHTAEHWLDSLDRVYGEVGNWVHRPRPIPISPCQQSDIDLALAVWHTSTPGFEDVATLRSHALFDLAYKARQGGKYLASLRLLISLIQQTGIEPRSLKALAKLPLHWIARRASACPRVSLSRSCGGLPPVPTARRLEEVDQGLRGLNHEYQAIQETHCMTTEMDRAIVGWQHAEVMYMQVTRSAASTNESVLAQRFWDEAYWLRENGRHLTAFRMLR